MNVSQRNTLFAHVFFLVAALAPLAIGIANFVPMSTGTAGGVGFLLLVPLTLLCFAALIAGVVRTVRLRGPRSLVILSILGILYVATFFMSDSDVLPGWLSRVLPLVLGMAMIGVAVRGLAVSRRERAQAGSVTGDN